jgi:hypothetical protein
MENQPDFAARLAAIRDDGFVVMSGLFAAAEIQAIRDDCVSALSNGEGTLHAGDGSVYGARNVLQLWPSVASVWRRPLLSTLFAAALGPRFGLVRVLFFDKPPGQTWALP